ncbi:MAG: UDP-3-O-(3-hydroxymyristoyl)glucosamine N-acyltransferase [Candidatus Zixiibacteriota bacterium]
MRYTVRDLAGRLGARLDGNGDVAITGVGGIETASTGDLTFLANPKYIPFLKTTGASAIILPPAGERFRYTRDDVRADTALLEHDNPYFAFLQALTLYNPPPSPPPPGIDPTASIGVRVTIADGVHIGPHCTVGDDVVIGEGTLILANSFVGAESVVGTECMIGPMVTILHGSTLGNRVRVHPGTVVGSDGFGYAPKDGRHHKIPQVGGVTIHDDVEIGAGCTIDRATMGQTVIGRGTKIDNLVQIAHNVQIGEDCIIVSQVGISGSTKLGNRVTVAGQVGIIGHLTIGDDVIIAAQSGVAKDIPSGGFYFGSPAVEARRQKRVLAAVNNLPDTLRTIRQLERRIAELEAQLKKDKTL